MNNETKSDTPETDAAIEQYAHLLPNWLATDIVGAVSRKLERERDRMQDLAEANGTLAHSNACEAMDYRRERNELRAALTACMEDSIELLSERGWWKDESRCGYARRYEQTTENIKMAQNLLTNERKA